MDARVEMTRAQLNKLFSGTLDLAKAESGGATVSGDRAAIGKLLAVMDQPGESPVPNISLR